MRGNAATLHKQASPVYRQRPVRIGGAYPARWFRRASRKTSSAGLEPVGRSNSKAASRKAGEREPLREYSSVPQFCSTLLAKLPIERGGIRSLAGARTRGRRTRTAEDSCPIAQERPRTDALPLSARRARCETASTPLGYGGRRRRRHRRLLQTASDFRGYIFSAPEICDQSLDRPDWSPRNAPPPRQQAETSPR